MAPQDVYTSGVQRKRNRKPRPSTDLEPTHYHYQIIISIIYNYHQAKLVITVTNIVFFKLYFTETATG